MALLNDDKLIDSNKSTYKAEGVQIRVGNPFAQSDYALIISTYEKEISYWPKEDYALAYHYKDIYSTRNFSERVQEQMNYYPGIHQTSPVPGTDPMYVNAKGMAEDRLQYWNNVLDNPDSFMNALRSDEQDFDYTTIFGSNASAKDRATNIGKILTECIPCFGRKVGLDDLLPDLDLLNVHLGNIGARTDLLDQIKKLFTDPGSYIDICELLNLLSSLCPQDLLAMLVLLSQYLAKMNLDIRFNIDFIINLVGAILSPFLNALSQWLDKWIQMILDPMICVIDHINEVIILSQQFQIPFKEATGSATADLGPFGVGAAGFSANAGEEFDAAYVNSFVGSDNYTNTQTFDAPNPAAYKESRPEWPAEIVEMSGDEVKESWNPSFSEEERAKRNERFEELRQENLKKQYQKNLALDYKYRRQNPPNREEYYPPEQQPQVKAGNYYWNPAPLVNSIVQMRNIMQAAVQYVSDWFSYVTQMIYDLVGMDIGWMQNKTGSSFLKSRVIELILIIKSILEAVSKNGLRCGQDSNFDIEQMRFIFENGLNKYSNSNFKVLDDGSIQVTPPGMDNIPDAEDLSNEIVRQQEEQASGDTSSTKTGVINAGQDFGDVSLPTSGEVKQKAVKSGIIIKNCLKDLTSDQIDEAKAWIAEYERRSNG
jgi:hypothetical protein